MLPAWVYLITVLVATTAYTFKKLYPTAAARAQLVVTGGGNPALRFLYGRLNGSSIGALTAWRYGIWAAIFGALMTIFIVIRHTRGDEEAGRLELVGSAAVGRQAALTAGLLTAVTANVAIAVLLSVALPASGCRSPARSRSRWRSARAGWRSPGSPPSPPSSPPARAARGGFASACSAPHTCSARSVTRPAERAVLADLDVAAGLGGARPALRRPAVVGAGAAARGAGRRTSARPTPWPRGATTARGCCRTGPAGQRLRPAARAAGPGLAVAAGPARRLGGRVCVASSPRRGAAAKGIGSLLGGSTQLRNEFTRLGGQAAITNAYLAALMLLAGLGAAGYATSAVLRLRAEETGGLAEPLLATAVGRIRWGLSHVPWRSSAPRSCWPWPAWRPA